MTIEIGGEVIGSLFDQHTAFRVGAVKVHLPSLYPLRICRQSLVYNVVDDSATRQSGKKPEVSIKTLPTSAASLSKRHLQNTNGNRKHLDRRSVSSMAEHQAVTVHL